ncbi:type 1 fimbrial protein subunit FimA [Salmonella enterica]|uniref:Type 1 fimbrial protein subunit FimA n=1 Tax=Salmonella paratyphi B TaxID=57045 RepID=A0A5T5I9L1_SALEB|nr:type 1 fimbrial protein subunit FimA [Salmonella enterica subsp. enterica serovar Paratyphi B]EBQ4422047.1 type 1 fimbrial protein subunit FimA [Salmonella enterica]ECJ4682039.1 type-1 fimbrial protein subunit A [Salmonella enterica subsp. enterica]EGZ4470594.1 fimbrial protein [Salmonella enterica subsp. enterica serovar Java]EBM1042956.1 type 1 fimbrial protein subunit FimA [Salmonella enterica subsp. enterica serovar Paratyphi B]
MNKLIISSIALSLFSATTIAATTTPVAVNGGAVHFKGEIVNAACAVDAGSSDQTIRLGQVRSSKLTADGNVSSPVGFAIQLDDCDTTVAGTASVAFTGSEVSGKNNVLAVQATGAGAATNVGVQILDSHSQPLQLDGTNFGSTILLTNGTNTIPLQARYIATGAATAGTANADATFKIQYQ